MIFSRKRRFIRSASTLLEDDWDARKEVFAVSYQETLLALKHQDDKLNRALTGLAFLTAAGVALFTNLRGDPDPSFSPDGFPPRTFFFLLFIGFAALALLLILAAIGPSTPLSRSRRKSDEKDSDFRTSVLYFGRIIRDEHWDEHLAKSSAELNRLIASNYHLEAKFLSRRIVYKISRSREAAAFLHLSVVCLSLLGLYSAEQIDTNTKWWFSSSFLVLLFLIPFWDLYRMKHYDFPDATPDPLSYQILGLVVILVSAALFSAPVNENEWPALIYALLALLAVRLAYAVRSRGPWLLSATVVAGFLVVVLFPW